MIVQPSRHSPKKAFLKNAFKEFHTHPLKAGRGQRLGLGEDDVEKAPIKILQNFF